MFAVSPCSCASPLVLRPRRPSSVELPGKPVEAGLPQVAVAARPIIKLAEPLGAQGVQPSPPIRADAHKAGLLKDPELTRDARLADIHDLDQLVHGALARPECLDEAATGWVGQDLEDIGHHDILLAQHMSCQR